MLRTLNPKISRLFLALSVAVLFARAYSNPAGAWAPGTPQDLPQGAGAGILRERCLACHEADIIVGQKLSRAGWVREVDKMIRWGAIVPEPEKNQLVDYLAINFAPKTPATGAASDVARGREIFENKCTVCHESDLTENQRLTRNGWTREVDKMIRWGATVTDAEKGPLIDFLASNYGPK